ncbi:MAG: box helicase protein [Clostridia bacterium]|nr:box helicase protein [Clostridia bacterium]
MGSRRLGQVELSWGKVTVSGKVHGCLLKRFDHSVTKETLDGIPPIEFDTVAAWCRFTVPSGLGGSLGGGLHAAEHALIAVTPLLAMCDRWDIGGSFTPDGPGGKPAIFIYDGFPGGTGIAERLYQYYGKLASRALELVLGCNCWDGCPRCIMSPKCGNNNEPPDKKACLHVVDILSREMAGERGAG